MQKPLVAGDNTNSPPELSLQDTTKHIHFWYVLWCAGTKKRPEGA